MPPTTWGADFTGCGNTDPDHSWYGGLIELDGGRDDGWLETPAGRSPDDTYPIGYYTESSLPVLGALARSYTALDGYFCALLAETFPNRLYMHAAQTDRDHNLNPPSSASGEPGTCRSSPPSRSSWPTPRRGCFRGSRAWSCLPSLPRARCTAVRTSTRLSCG